MVRSLGRPSKTRKLSEYLEVRLEPAEKAAFKEAAEIAGVPLSTWIRERLRQVTVRELEALGRPVAFLGTPDIPTGSFWQSKTLDELAAEQGVSPIKSVDELTGHWPADADFEAFLEAARSARR